MNEWITDLLSPSRTVRVRSSPSLHFIPDSSVYICPCLPVILAGGEERVWLIRLSLCPTVSWNGSVTTLSFSSRFVEQFTDYSCVCLRRRRDFYSLLWMGGEGGITLCLPKSTNLRLFVFEDTHMLPSFLNSSNSWNTVSLPEAMCFH